MTAGHLTPNGVQALGSDQSGAALFDGVLENFEGLNTNTAVPGAYLYFDMGEGNDQPISMARLKAERILSISTFVRSRRIS